MRAFLVALSLAVPCVAAAAARADDVVLKNGRAFHGTIVEENDREVVIACAAGKLTFERYQIESLKRTPGSTPPSPAPNPEPSDPPKKSGTDPHGANATPPVKADAPKTPRTKTPADRLAQLVAIRLVAWTDEPSTPCDEPGAKQYKIVGSDGVKMRDERPKSPEGIDALYVRNDAELGQFIEIRDGARRTYWYRLHWHDATREWTVVHPDLEEFQKDCALAGRVADDACKDENGRIGACIAEQSIVYALQKDRGASAAKERAELRKCCATATGSAVAGELLAQYHELNVDIGYARRPSEKIALAMKRRDVLGNLLAAVGR